MKKSVAKVLLMGLIMFGVGSSASASTLTFDDPSSLGVSLGGSMMWNGDGGGHLYMEQWSNTDYIIMLDPSTVVNDFKMNFQPWEGYGQNPQGSSGWPVDIKALDASNNVIWSQSVDLTSTANDWNSWITVTVNKANVAQLLFGPTGGGNEAGWQPQGYWPSIDNLRINESTTPTPIPAAIYLFGAGIAGLVGIRRKKKNA